MIILFKSAGVLLILAIGFVFGLALTLGALAWRGLTRKGDA